MDLELFPSLLVSGVLAGIGGGALAVGLGLIVGVTGRFHFAYALTFTLAAFLAASWTSLGGMSPILALVLAVGVCTVVGVLIERFIYRPLDKGSPADLLPIFVSSLGLNIAGTYVIVLTWARETPSLAYPLAELHTVELPFGVFVARLDLVVAGCLLLTALGVAGMLRWTPWGLAVRAVRSNPTMSQTVGIDPRRVNLGVFAVGSAVSALAGTLAASRLSASPDMATQPLFTAFVIVFLAGTKAPPGRVLLLGIVLGVLETTSALWVPTQYSRLVVFLVLLLFLVLKSAELAPRVRAFRQAKAA